MVILESSQTLIRLAIPQDKKEIIKLEKLAIQNLCDNDYDAGKIKYSLENPNHFYFQDEITFVAEKDCQVIGFASLLSYRKVVRNLYVKAEGTIRQEVETKLLNIIEEEAIKQRITTLKATPFVTEKDFYNSRGYQEIAVCHLDKMDVLVPCVAMQKQLISSPYSILLFKTILKIILATVPGLFFLLLII